MPKDASKDPPPIASGMEGSSENDIGGRRGRRGRGRGQGTRSQPGRGRGSGGRRFEGSTNFADDVTVGEADPSETTPNNPDLGCVSSEQLEEAGRENARRGRGVGSQRGRGRGRGGRTVIPGADCELSGHIGEEETGGAALDYIQRPVLAPIPAHTNNNAVDDDQELEMEKSLSQYRLEEQIAELQRTLSSTLLFLL